MFSFACSGGSNSRVQVLWRREGEPLPAGRTTAGKDGILRITSLQVSDTGHYTCTVTSGSGVSEVTVELMVHGEYILRQYMVSRAGQNRAGEERRGEERRGEERRGQGRAGQGRAE